MSISRAKGLILNGFKLSGYKSTTEHRTVGGYFHTCWYKQYNKGIFNQTNKKN